MDRKIITIQTNTQKKGKLDQRTFPCQILEFENQRIYVLDDTKRDAESSMVRFVIPSRISSTQNDLLARSL